MPFKLTDDEVLYATNEVIQQLEENLQELLKRHNGKIVKAYGSKVFRVDEMEYRHGNVWAKGFVLKKDGEPGVRTYGVPLDDAEFV